MFISQHSFRLSIPPPQPPPTPLTPPPPPPPPHNPPTAQQKYGTPCHVRCIKYTVIDWFFPYLAQMITSLRGCVVCNDL